MATMKCGLIAVPLDPYFIIIIIQKYVILIKNMQLNHNKTIIANDMFSKQIILLKALQNYHDGKHMFFAVLS